MDPKLFAVGSVFVAMTGLVLWVGFGIVRARKAATERLAVYGSADFIREETLKKPVAERAVAPVFLALGRLLGRFTPVGWLKKTQRRIVLAGSPGNLDANSWAVIKLLTSIGALILWFFLQGDLEFRMKVMTFALLAILGFFGPDVWLTRKVDNRRLAMQRALPDVLDLLVISVEAGPRIRFGDGPGGRHRSRTAVRRILPNAARNPGRSEPPGRHAAPHRPDRPG